MEKSELNLGKLFQKLIREGYKYADRLSDYLEDIGTINIGEFELEALIDFYYPALIPPLSVLATRADIRKNFPISVEFAVIGGAKLKAWRNDVLMKFLHHSNLAPSKHRPDALYDVFTKTSVLGSEHILALA
ncbi:hypothetical protein GLOIN_2v1769172 [Rhizophagus irregularis DAOM 181602=DAOM 197198]|uniref:Uncharacterized protein n=1 Tax=Rhizophagus irregularis (strain DAOM 181602 / DAOM 197198 / MUCL 43194) TaxID=747089 RepID=A0A2P4QFE7_RHIID|nr:hypothetical protein GLOIN_2v1769172 [Rhizophagus irregularis DAOM 181602=DAOM 197198]POG76361.1 hypothetical protein GLOIN_2v1769172 [Rhizophagus irregularis DAOM 181602=DAOM 197198]|eukprot:XP_025183227.1 hypothetical protein GLOIN_2v1769172 [Rhizophagus irregularis DAOM 181602=DAOM 197198]